MPQASELTFPNVGSARAVRVHEPNALPAALHALDLNPPRRVMVLVGGAGAMSERELARLRPLFHETLAPLAEQWDLVVMDGGTDAGIMRLMGEARAPRPAAVPLIGVAADGTVALPNAAPQPGMVPLEPHHSGFLLVPGSTWGDESQWPSDAATVLAGGAPSVTVLVNGGDIAWLDVRHSVEANRLVIAIAGSGRTADELDAALRGSSSLARARVLAGSGLIHSIDLDQAARELARAIQAIWSRKE